MRTPLIVALTALLTTAGIAHADLRGVFQTAPNDDGNVGHVEFYDCAGLTCGKLIRSYDAGGAALQSANVGRNIVWDMAVTGTGTWGKGKIWDPGADKTYRSKMAIDGNTLKVSGCIGPICRGNTWVRVK